MILDGNGPFGDIVSQSGPIAADNPFRFSSKYFDDESGLSYYGYRYYEPELGRWLSRDPIGEVDDVNIYSFVKNMSQDFIDSYGLAKWPEWDPAKLPAKKPGKPGPKPPKPGDPCCVDPCEIKNFVLSDASPKKGKPPGKVKADWKEKGVCKGVQLFWWTCTEQRAPFWPKRGKQRPLIWWPGPKVRDVPPTVPTIPPKGWKPGDPVKYPDPPDPAHHFARIDAYSCIGGKWVAKTWFSSNSIKVGGGHSGPMPLPGKPWK